MVLAVNNGENPTRVARVSAERGYRFPVLLDRAGDAHRAYGVTLRPTTVIVGPDGTVRAVRAGAHGAGAWAEELRRQGLGR